MVNVSPVVRNITQRNVQENGMMNKLTRLSKACLAKVWNGDVPSTDVKAFIQLANSPLALDMTCMKVSGFLFLNMHANLICWFA